MQPIDDAQQWDSALKALPEPHVLQTWAWGAFKGRSGWSTERFLWGAVDHPMAAAQILTQQRGRSRLGYIPKGPTLDWGDPAQVEAVLSDLEGLARRSAMLTLKLDPDVRADTPEGKAVVALLKRRGWRPSFEQIQFRNTMTLDLRADLDTLMDRMKSKWRYNIRLAVRKGVTVRTAGLSELSLLYRMYAETAERDAFIIREEPYYRDVWKTFMEAGLATPLIAEAESDPVAMMVLFHFGARAWYMYGASTELHREYMPNYLLQWEAVRKVQALGCTTYDLWGAPDTLDEADPLWGVYRFKAGFGAEFVPHIGAYDYAPHALLYRLYAFLRPRWVALAQRLYWAKRPRH